MECVVIYSKVKYTCHTCNKSRGVGASTATPALAVVDFGPTYLVGLLRATYFCATHYI